MDFGNLVTGSHYGINKVIFYFKFFERGNYIRCIYDDDNILSLLLFSQPCESYSQQEKGV